MRIPMDDFRLDAVEVSPATRDVRDERRSHVVADILLKHAVMDAGILTSLSGWQEGKNAAVAIANLLYWPERYPEMRFAAAACRLQAGDFLLQLGDRDEANRLYALVAATKERPLACYRDQAKARLAALERSLPKH